MKRFALFTAVVFAILLGLALAWRLSSILLVFAASVVIAATLGAPIEWLVARRIPRRLATLLTYAGTVLLALGLLVFLYERLGYELASLSEDLSYIYAHLRTQFGVLWQIGPRISGQFPTPEQMTRLLAEGQDGSLNRAVLSAGENLAGLLSNVALMLILSLYWIADRLRFERLALSLVPAHHRGAARSIWRTIEAGLGRYVRSEILQSLLAGIVLAPLFVLLGLRWPVFWALAASLAWLVPMVGGFIVIVPMAIVVWVQSGLLTAALAVAATLVVLGLLEFGLERRLYTRERGTNVLTIMVVLVMADAFGLPGLLLAPPVAIVVHILLSELADPGAARAPRPKLEADVTGLEARLAEVRALLAAQENGNNLRLASLADRLASLLVEARQLEE